MIAILNSLPFSLLISVSSGLSSGCLLFALWSGDVRNYLMLEVCVFPILILFGHSYCLLRLCGGQKLHILNPPPSAEMMRHVLGEGTFS